MSRTAILPEGSKAPVLPLSMGLRKGNILQVAGQVAFHPATGEVLGTTVAEQTRQTLRNVLSILQAGGGTPDDLVMVRVYLTDTAHFAEMNAAYAELIPEPFPARTTVYVGLPAGLLVEIDAMAVLDS